MSAPVVAMFELARAVAESAGLKGDALDYALAVDALNELVDAALAGAVAAEDLAEGRMPSNLRDAASSVLVAKRIRAAVGRVGGAA